MRSKNKISHKMMAVLAAALIAVMLLTSCGGGGGGGGGSTGGGSSTVEPTPTPDPTPDPAPTPEPDPEPEPGEMIAIPDERTGWVWNIRPTGSNTAKLVCTGYNGTDEPSGSLTFPEKLGQYTITEIGSNVFRSGAYNGAAVEEIIVPASVTKIADEAFYYIPELKKVTIKGPAKLGKRSFCYCYNLEEVNLNDNITEIPDEAFALCYALTQIHLPANLKTIGEAAFENTGLQEVVFPESVRSIGKDAFRIVNNQFTFGLTYIKLNQGLEEVGDGAFSGVTANHIYLPHSVKRIGEKAFGSGDAYAERVVYYEGSASEWQKVSIGNGYNDWNTARIVYNATPEYYDAVRDGTKDEIVWRFQPNGVGTMALVGYDWQSLMPSGSIVLPDAVETVSGRFPVTGIESAVSYCTGVTSVKIPEGVQYAAGFENCTALSSVSLPKSLRTLSFCAFSGCTSLTNISLPEGMTTIETGAFNGCTALSNVSLPSTLKTIGADAFSGCRALRTIRLPEGLQTIGDSAFSGNWFTTITIPSSVTEIGARAFYDCPYLETVILNGGCKFGTDYNLFPKGAFSNCSKLREVQMNGDIEEIPAHMFESCCALNKLKLPARLKTIGTDAFSGCGVEEMKLPDTVTTIAEEAFEFSYVRKIALSKGMKTIPHRAFYASNLRAVYIPASMEKIDVGAFENCALTDIYYSGSEADWANMKVESTGNEALTKATIHYNASVSDLGLTEEFSLLSLLGL